MKDLMKMIVLLLLLVVLGGQEAMAARKVEVVLKGQAQPIVGYLREVGQTRYILQGEDQFFEFSSAELVSVNGQKSPVDEDLGQGKLVYTTRYEKILPSGDVEVWFNIEVDNTGSTMIESVTWGAGESEVTETRGQEVHDQFGNLIPTLVTPREGGGYKVEIRLPVPVAPMEHVSLNVMRLEKGAVKSSGAGQWRYTFNCDFPEDRFFVRKVELPDGVEVEAPAGWWLNRVEGRVFLCSHFYFPARTVVPQVIEYRLP